METTKMRNYLRNWNLMRTLRLASGIVIIIQGVHAGQWIITSLGAWFTLMPLLNMGCGGASGCDLPVRRKGVENTGDTTCEEVR